MNATPLPPQGPGTPGPSAGPAPEQGPWTGPGTPPPGAGGPIPPRAGLDAFFDSVRRMGVVRSDQRWIGGVAGGVAQRLGIDPLVVRGIFAVSVLLGGLGLVVYGLGWLLLPEERDSRIHLQQLFRGDFDAAVLGGFALFFIGLGTPGRWGPGMGDAGWWQGLVWLSAIALVIVLITSSSSRNRAARRAAQPPYGPPAYGPTAPPPYVPAATTYPPRPGEPVSPQGTAPTSTFTSTSEGPTTTMYPTATYAPPVAPPPPGGPAPWAQQGPPPPPARLPRPPRRGPGAGVLGVVVALTLLTLAGLLYAHRVGSFDGPVGLTVGAVAVILLGVAIIVSGLRGRTGGGLGVLAVLGIISLVPLSVAHTDGWDWNGDWGNGSAINDISTTPTDVTTAERGYSVGAGNARIDLTQLPVSGSTVTVPLHVGAGDLTVVLPHNGDFSAEISVVAGEVRWLGDTVSSGFNPGGDQRTYQSPSVRDGATPDITLDITVGAGTVRVEEN